MAQPVVRACITSEWSPKIDRAWVAMVRAATWITAGVSSPAILNMLGTISNSPCDAVNVVAKAPFCKAPWRVPAAPASDCISITSGTWPQRFCLLCCRPVVGQLAHRGRRRDRVDGDHFRKGVGDSGRGLVAVDTHPLADVHNSSPVHEMAFPRVRGPLVPRRRTNSLAVANSRILAMVHHHDRASGVGRAVFVSPNPRGCRRPHRAPGCRRPRGRHLWPLPPVPLPRPLRSRRLRGQHQGARRRPLPQARGELGHNRGRAPNSVGSGMPNW